MNYEKPMPMAARHIRWPVELLRRLSSKYHFTTIAKVLIKTGHIEYNREKRCFHWLKYPVKNEIHFDNVMRSALSNGVMTSPELLLTGDQCLIRTKPQTPTSKPE